MKINSRLSAFLKCVGYVFLFLACRQAAGLITEAVVLATLLNQGLSQNELVMAAMNAEGALIYETMILSGLLFLGIAALIKRKSFAEDSAWKKTNATAVAAGAFHGFAWYLFASAIVIVAAYLPAVKTSQDAYLETYEQVTQNANLWAEILYVCILGPIVEETLCRGLIQKNLEKTLRPFSAIFLSALIFSLIHGNLYQIVFTLPLGLVMGYFSYRFDSILPTIALHICFNASNYLVRIGFMLGYDETHPVTAIFYYAAMLFFLIAIPIGRILLREAQKTCPREAKKAFPSEIAQETTEKGFDMATPEYMIVGLGNPGDKYAENRHNCGFMALDYIALRENTQMKNLRFRSLMGESVIDGKKVLFLKPQTFMNLSGEAVRECAAFYKIPPEKILVIFDDISFEPGVFRIREKGSAGGHNGIKSIISCLSSDAFPRVKMGVGNVPEGWDLMHWVLGNPSPEDQKKIIASLEDVYQTVKLFVKDDLQKAAQLYNGKKHE
ncbi:MAG: aminoacyl-tRNA hydrolase [Clostridia bacterium]|nr:aminoacyl-tRNA hydrolase [Clostridia bacterium]